MYSVEYFGSRSCRNAEAMVIRGRYYDAIEAYKHILAFDKIIKENLNYKNTIIEIIADCYNRLGEFEKSNGYLESVKQEEDPDHESIAEILYAQNLLFMGKNLNKAEQIITDFRKDFDLVESMLTHALIELEKGNKEKSDKLIDEYKKRKALQRNIIQIQRGVSNSDNYSEAISEKFMLGLYYYKTNNTDKAKKFFSRVSKSKVECYLVEKAKEYLEVLC